MNDEMDITLKEENKEAVTETKEKQAARSFLRERFLRAVSGVVGKKCTFHMFSNTNVDGIFRGSDIEFDDLLAEKLKTPFAEIPHSKIRATDVHYISFDYFSKKKN